MTAAIGIVMDTTKNTQKFYGAGQVNPINNADGHNDDIESLDINSDRTKCVTGQRGQNPLVCYWDISTCKSIQKFSIGRGNRAAKCVRFDKSGKYIIVADEHNDHNVHIFNLSGQKIAMMKSGGDPIYDMDTGKGSYIGAIATKRGVQFLEFNDNLLNIKKGIFGGNPAADQTSICSIKDGSQYASGSINGSLYLWSGNQCMKSVQVHKGTIHCVSFKENKLMTSAYGDK